MKVKLPDIRHNRGGFAALTRLHAEIKNCRFETIEIDMGATEWFDADMCAAFGAILHLAGSKPNTVQLANIPSRMEAILSKNGFLAHYGRAAIPDQWGTTIPYRHIGNKDARLFDSAKTALLDRSEIPPMSSALSKQFERGVFEIFENAATHSDTQLGIFICGQFFPNRNHLDFSVVDLGVGIRQKVQQHIGRDISPEQAVTWAMQPGNTTKRGPIPGGLGLKLLRDFIDLNAGCIQIVSDAGYWRRKNKESVAKLMEDPFPGTLVSLEINTADEKSYILASEADASNALS